MRELLLKLLTYEPLVDINGAEREFIDYILDNDVMPFPSNPQKGIYADLLFKFMKNVKEYEKTIKKFNYLNKKFRKVLKRFDRAIDFDSWVQNHIDEFVNFSSWHQKYYEVYKGKNGSYLRYKANKTRAVYPVLFKKICFYCLTEFEGITDKDFFNSIGMNPNLLAKWKISPAYRRKLNDNGTYRNLPMYRSGKKAEYLVTAVKAAYYEASRQYRGTEESLPKKKELLPFCDCFAGTGVV